MKHGNRYQPFNPPNEQLDNDYEPGKIGQPDPAVLPEMAQAVRSMGTTELVDRLIEAGRMGWIREFEGLLRAAGIHEKDDEGTFVSELWMIFNVFGAPPNRLDVARPGAIQEINEWLGRGN